MYASYVLWYTQTAKAELWIGALYRIKCGLRYPIRILYYYFNARTVSCIINNILSQCFNNVLKGAIRLKSLCARLISPKGLIFVSLRYLRIKNDLS